MNSLKEMVSLDNNGSSLDQMIGSQSKREFSKNSQVARRIMMKVTRQAKKKKALTIVEAAIIQRSAENVSQKC
jgi:ribosomal protein S7